MTDKEKPPKYKLYICKGCGTSNIGYIKHTGMCYDNEQVQCYEVPRKNKRLVQCPKCGAIGRGRLFQEFHFSNCKGSNAKLPLSLLFIEDTS